MVGFRWPHQAGPRQVRSIVDDQVMRWSLRRDEKTDQALSGGDGKAEGGDRPQVAELQGGRKRQTSDRLGFHSWGEVIVAELTRMMQADLHAENDHKGWSVENPMVSAGHGHARRRRRSAPGKLRS